jgi:hypothetical protein
MAKDPGSAPESQAKAGLMDGLNLIAGRCLILVLIYGYLNTYCSSYPAQLLQAGDAMVAAADAADHPETVQYRLVPGNNYGCTTACCCMDGLASLLI